MQQHRRTGVGSGENAAAASAATAAAPKSARPRVAPGREAQRVEAEARHRGQAERAPRQPFRRVPHAVERREAPQPGARRPGRGEQDAERGEDREDEREAAAMLLAERRGRGDEHEGRQEERREVRPAEGGGRESRHRARVAPGQRAGVALLGRECVAAFRVEGELGHGRDHPRRKRQPQADSSGEAPHPGRARLRREGLGKLLARAPREGAGQHDRRRGNLRAARHGLQPDQRPEAERRAAGAKSRARHRCDSGQVGPRAEVVPVHRERSGEPRRGEGRRSEERARVGHVLFLEKAPCSPRRDCKVQQQEEGARERRRMEEEEKGRRIEDARLSVGEPRLPRAGQRVPQRDLARAQAVGRVELERVEEVALVAKRGRPPVQQSGSEPEDGGQKRRGPANPGEEPSAEPHDSDSKPFGGN